MGNNREGLGALVRDDRESAHDFQILSRRVQDEGLGCRVGLGLELEIYELGWRPAKKGFPKIRDTNFGGPNKSP